MPVTDTLFAGHFGTAAGLRVLRPAGLVQCSGCAGDHGEGRRFEPITCQPFAAVRPLVIPNATKITPDQNSNFN